MKHKHLSHLRRSRGFAVVVAAGLALGTVAACGSNDDAGTADGGDASSAGTTEAAGSTDSGGSNDSNGQDTSTEISGTVDWWGWAPVPAVAEELIAEFNKVYPNVTVNYKYHSWTDYVAAMAPAIRSDEAPDVFGLVSGGEGVGIASYGEYMHDLTAAAEAAAGPNWRDTVAPGYLAMEIRDDGAVVGLPFAGVAAGFGWVNQDMLDERGLTYPTNYDEWVSTCATLAEEDITCLAVGAARGDFMTIIETVRPFANSFDPTFFYGALQGERQWDDQVWVDTLTKVKQMYDDGIFPEDVLGILTSPDATNLFLQGKALLVATGSWYAQDTVKDMMIAAQEAAGVSNPEPFTILPVSYPDVAGLGNEPVWFGDTDYGLAITESSDNIPAAEALVTFMTLNPTAQQISVNLLQAMPVLVGMMPDFDAVELVNPEVQKPALEEMINKATSVTESRQFLMDTDCVNAVYDSIITVLDGSATPEESAQRLQQELG
ncbi:MAG: extracellular solute-binding protein [Bifidobacteriaceae bacterium]|jgi:ABC-type glycerol-3-phosphate transport system substrate-binding protein|nr:extracellular solute-binding protein [Bifidobacteriaceae bacterium]